MPFAPVKTFNFVMTVEKLFQDFRTVLPLASVKTFNFVIESFMLFGPLSKKWIQNQVHK